MILSRVKGRIYFDSHTTHRLKDLEGVKLATFRKRAFAMAIDLSFVGALLLTMLLSHAIVQYLDQLVGPSEDAKHIVLADYAKNHIVQFAILLGYFGLSTYFSNGKTLGKWVMRIRVLSTVHDHMNLWHSLERGLGYLASSLEFGFGFMQYFIDPNRRCVHDRIAETIVVEEKVVRKLKRIA